MAARLLMMGVMACSNVPTMWCTLSLRRAGGGSWEWVVLAEDLASSSIAQAGTLGWGATVRRCDPDPCAKLHQAVMLLKDPSCVVVGSWRSTSTLTSKITRVSITLYSRPSLAVDCASARIFWKMNRGRSTDSRCANTRVEISATLTLDQILILYRHQLQDILSWHYHRGLDSRIDLVASKCPSNETRCLEKSWLELPRWRPSTCQRQYQHPATLSKTFGPEVCMADQSKKTRTPRLSGWGSDGWCSPQNCNRRSPVWKQISWLPTGT